MVYCAPFFLAGGLLYLYREKVGKFNRLMLGVLAAAVTVVFFVFPGLRAYAIGVVISELVLFVVWLLYPIRVGGGISLLHNPVVDYISGISMEIYLCHMLVYRAIEKVDLSRYISSPDFLYMITVILTLSGAMIFSHIIKYVLFQRTIDKLMRK